MELRDMPQEVIGGGLIATGTSISWVQSEWIENLSTLANLAVDIGNVVLIFGGVVLVLRKVFDKRRNRRKSDVVEPGDDS